MSKKTETQTELELDAQVVELGDAKEVTMGVIDNSFSEDNPHVLGKFA